MGATPKSQLPPHSVAEDRPIPQSNPKNQGANADRTLGKLQYSRPKEKSQPLSDPVSHGEDAPPPGSASQHKAYSLGNSRVDR